MWARVMPTMSRCPGDRVASRGDVVDPCDVCSTARPVAARTSPAKSRCGADRMPWIGMTSVSAASLTMWPRMTLTKSISRSSPADSRREDLQPDRRVSMPPVQSLVDGHADADDEVVADALADRPQHPQGKRRRLSSEPP